MPYTDPSGGYQNLTTNSFVVYFVGKLVTPSASGSPLTGASGASLNIGKIGFSTASTTAIDFSFGDIYAADSENTSLNVISSLSADNPLLSGTYDVLTVPAGTSPLLGKASALPSINDTSSTGATYNLAGTVATLNATVRGAGTFDGAKLAVSDLKLTSESAGAMTLSVKRAANVNMSGNGTVTILGSPACTVKNVGSGTVSCGSDQPQR
jgi:hypothetical protein